MKKALTYDDVNIVPKYSELLSRGDVKLNTQFTKNTELTIPIVASPMDTICEFDMALEMMNWGGAGIVHRFMSIDKQSKIVRELKKVSGANIEIHGSSICAAIGVTGDYFERAQELVKNGCNVLFIDVAHGHHVLVKNVIEELKNEFGENVEVIGGSIATKEAATDLCEWGADALRVGVGNGSLCETRIRTGVGLPQFTTLLDISPVADNYGVPIISDGGCRYVGDVAKGLGAGADSVMLGSLLSGTKETPGEITKVGEWPNERLYKKYRGSASIDSKSDRGEYNNVEGNSKIIPYKGKVKRIISDIRDGLSSSLSYVGASDVLDFQSKCEFVQVTQAGVVEAKPHLL